MTLFRLNFVPVASLLVIASCFSTVARGQSIAPDFQPAPSGILLASSGPAAIPDAPCSSSLSTDDDPQASGPAPQSTAPLASEGDEGTQTKRIFGVIPNFRSVSANAHLPPQPVKEKFITATQDSFDYSSILTPALLAAYSYGRNSTPEFGTGGVAFSRYLWHSVVDQTTENYFVEFIVPAITREDTRYYTLGHGGFIKRTGYALKHVVVTRNDAGTDTFNAGEVVGAALSAALSNAYYPAPERNFSDTAQQFGLSIGIDAFTFAAREFWPDINHSLFHGAKPQN